MRECQGTRPTRRCQHHFYLSPRLLVDARDLIGPAWRQDGWSRLPLSGTTEGTSVDQAFFSQVRPCFTDGGSPRHPPYAFTVEVVEGDAVRYVLSSGRTPVLKQGACLVLRSRKDAIFCHRRRYGKGGLSRLLPTRRDTAVLG